MCGLKQLIGKLSCFHARVTPFVGVWIETNSLPQLSHFTKVTPFVGVWIETRQNQLPIVKHRVTPFVGVWIETTFYTYILNTPLCHTLRGCVD